MKPNKDLYLECNDQGLMSPKDFEATFCRVCKNRECVRSGWGYSDWDERILTQVDRLLNNPNIAHQEESMDWQEITNFIPFKETEDWGSPQQSHPSPIIIQPLPEAQPAPPSIEAPPPAEVTPVKEPSPTPMSTFNTPNHEIMLGSEPPPAQTPSNDPWAVTTTVKVGGKFKMGG